MNKKTSKAIASKASMTLRSKFSSKLQKSIAGSVLAQSRTKKVTSERVERIASGALKSKTSASLTKKLAGSAVSQSTKKRGER